MHTLFIIQMWYFSISLLFQCIMIYGLDICFFPQNMHDEVLVPSVVEFGDDPLRGNEGDMRSYRGGLMLGLIRVWVAC